MHPTSPWTHGRHISPPLPAAFELSVPDCPAALRELLSYVSVLPEQFYGPQAGLASGRPEAALMCAVLEDALLCFQKGLLRQGRRVQRLAREAEEWLFSDDDLWPFSFVSICAVLGLEPASVRRGLQHWRQGQPSAGVKKQARIVFITRRLAA